MNFGNFRIVVRHNSHNRNFLYIRGFFPFLFPTPSDDKNQNNQQDDNQNDPCCYQQDERIPAQFLHQAFQRIHCLHGTALASVERSADYRYFLVLCFGGDTGCIANQRLQLVHCQIAEILAVNRNGNRKILYRSRRYLSLLLDLVNHIFPGRLGAVIAVRTCRACISCILCNIRIRLGSRNASDSGNTVARLFTDIFFGNNTCFIRFVDFIRSAVGQSLPDQLFHIDPALYGNPDIFRAINGPQKIHHFSGNLSFHDPCQFFPAAVLFAFCLLQGRGYLQPVAVKHRNFIHIHTCHAAGYQPLYGSCLFTCGGTSVLHNHHNGSAGTIIGILLQDISLFFSQGDGHLGILHSVKQAYRRSDAVLQIIKLICLLIRIRSHAARIVDKNAVREAALGIPLLRELCPDLIHLLLIHENIAIIFILIGDSRLLKF